MPGDGSDYAICLAQVCFAAGTSCHDHKFGQPEDDYVEVMPALELCLEPVEKGWMPASLLESIHADLQKHLIIKPLISLTKTSPAWNLVIKQFCTISDFSIVAEKHTQQQCSEVSL
ncbi:UNVERIFIED_CONTAM: hypothetical protein K2H54_036009 [Gekko kuhli]